MEDTIATMRPQRIQRRRTHGWRMPPNTVSVCRPGPWGNPFVVTTAVAPGKGSGLYTAVPTAEDACECFRLMLQEPARAEMVVAIRRELRGKHLACFCALGAPCHGDVLLKIANEET